MAARSPPGSGGSPEQESPTSHDQDDLSALIPEIPADEEETEQLRLIDPAPNEWELDDQTRVVGLRGVSQARRALYESQRRHPSSPK